jgi:hypothetical protein
MFFCVLVSRTLLAECSRNKCVSLLISNTTLKYLLMMLMYVSMYIHYVCVQRQVYVSKLTAI